LVLILLLAAFLRFYDLRELPPGLWFDEGLAGMNALRILHDDHFRLYSDNREFFAGSPEFGEEPMFHYLLALAIALAGPTVLALRATAALIGVLTVAAFYAMARVIWSSRSRTEASQAINGVALLATLLLAVFRGHVHFSRTVFRTTLVPLFACLLFLCWWRGVEKKSRAWLVAAGIVLGLGFYTYTAFQMIALTWLTFAAWRWWREKDRRREIARSVVWTGVVGLIVVSPLLVYFHRHPDVAAGRVGSLSLFKPHAPAPAASGATSQNRPQAGLPLLAKQAWDNVHHFWWSGDHVPRHNVPYEAVFDPVTSIVFAIGLLATILGAKRDSRNALLLLWMLWMACASIFSFGSPNLLRTLGMVPAVVLVLANGYLWIADQLARAGSKRAAAFAVGALVLWFGAVESYRYFVVWRNDPRVPGSFSVHEFELGQALRVLGRNADVHIAPDLYYHPSVQFLLYGQKDVCPIRLPESFARKPGDERDRLFAYWLGFWRRELPRANPSIDAPRALFPGGSEAWQTRDGLFRAYRVPVEQLLEPMRAEELVKSLKGGKP
jgi:4-amino-4-deoxy-L-arabinose transferase-like glycosyltransferase